MSVSATSGRPVARSVQTTVQERSNAQTELEQQRAKQARARVATVQADAPPPPPPNQGGRINTTA